MASAFLLVALAIVVLFIPSLIPTAAARYSPSIWSALCASAYSSEPSVFEDRLRNKWKTNAYPALSLALRDVDDRVKLLSLKVIGSIYAIENAELFRDSLCVLTKSNNSEVRMWAISDLAIYGDQRVAAYVATALSDKESTVRIQAARVIGLVGRDDDISTIIENLRDTNEIVRETLVRSLLRLKAVESKSYLEKILTTEKNPKVINAIEETINKFNSSDLKK